MRGEILCHGVMTRMPRHIAVMAGIAMLEAGLSARETQRLEAAAEASAGSSASVSGAPATPPCGPSPARSREGEGRRILSSAFVRIGPGGYILVQERDGTPRLLRDVTMRAKAYCGWLVSEGVIGELYCGKYANVIAAQTGDAAVHGVDSDHTGIVLDRAASPKAQYNCIAATIKPTSFPHIVIKPQ